MELAKQRLRKSVFSLLLPVAIHMKIWKLKSLVQTLSLRGLEMLKHSEIITAAVLGSSLNFTLTKTTTLLAAGTLCDNSAASL